MPTVTGPCACRLPGPQITRKAATSDRAIATINSAPELTKRAESLFFFAGYYGQAFQRDAAAVGAERAVLVTLARFSPAARKAATVTTPTVDLIDGDKLCDLVRDQQIGLRIVAQVDEDWFDRFDA
jgi:restriction endonuclease Mrr